MASHPEPTRRDSDSQPTSLSLLQRVRGDDPEAWRRLVQLYSPLVYTWCRRSGLAVDDCADVMQEVFRAVATGIGRFRRDRGGDTFRGWMWTITRNKLRDHYRKVSERPVAVGGSTAYGRLQEVSDDEPQVDPSDADGPGSLLHRALELIRRDFEESSWQAFWQVSVEGKPTAEVAAALRLSVFAVYQAKYRIMRRLREELDGLIDLPEPRVQPER